MSRGFDHIDTWVFDLDNTLYPASCRLFDQMDVKMGEFVARLLGIPYDEAKLLQKGLYQRHGTTLRGLMVEHGVLPEGYLDYVHNIDYAPVPHSPDLGAALARLPGRKTVFTNGTVSHAARVLARLGIAEHFAGIFDIIDSDYIPKPAEAPYRKFLAAHAIEPTRAAMFEDIARNLEVPHALGMTTVLVTSPDNRDSGLYNRANGTEHVHHETGDLTAFLKARGRV